MGEARVALDGIDTNRALRAREHQTALETLTSLATDRETLEVERAGHAARIESLRQAINDGTFQVDKERIARAIVAGG